MAHTDTYNGRLENHKGQHCAKGPNDIILESWHNGRARFVTSRSNFLEAEVNGSTSVFNAIEQKPSLVSIYSVK